MLLNSVPRLRLTQNERDIRQASSFILTRACSILIKSINKSREHIPRVMIRQLWI
jgi:hypothetical protein